MGRHRKGGEGMIKEGRWGVGSEGNQAKLTTMFKDVLG